MKYNKEFILLSIERGVCLPGEAYRPLMLAIVYYFGNIHIANGLYATSCDECSDISKSLEFIRAYDDEEIGLYQESSEVFLSPAECAVAIGMQPEYIRSKAMSLASEYLSKCIHTKETSATAQYKQFENKRRVVG